MGIYLNSGNEGFRRALRSEIYIDKTGMLAFCNKRLDTEQCYLCVSRPRRFGKSVTAQMLKAYYCKSCDSADLFEGRKIAQTPDYKKHLNQYNVIHVDMNDFLLPARDRGDIVETTDIFQQNVIRELCQIYPESVEREASYLPEVLAQIYADTKEQFIIIIDEWDALFREARGNTRAQKRYINLLHGLFKNTLSSGFLKLVYLTGILPIKKYNTQSALNNFEEFTMLRPMKLAEYTGFLEEEVRELCKKYQMDFKEAKQWYDGYSFLQTKHIYNPNSVVKAMLNAEYGTYWTRTETFESLRSYICLNFDGLQDAILSMLAGGRCFIKTDTFSNDLETFHNRDDVLTVLVHLGYLAYDSGRSEVYIPNEEIKREYQIAVENAGWDTVVKAVAASDQLLYDTWEGNEEKVAEGIAMVHMENTSILQYNDENSLSCVITLAYYNAMNEYTIIREMPSGKGIADMVFIPKRNSDRPAIIVELKYDDSAAGAITQIKEKQYVKALEEYQGNLLLVGINYNRKSKEHRCQIEKFVLE